LLTYLAYVVLLVLATALERTWPGWLLIYGQGPHVVIATVAAIGLSCGPIAGCFGGLVGGLLLGSVEGAWLGGTFAAYMGLGVAVGMMRGTLLAERMLVAVLVVLAVTPLVELVRLLFVAPPNPGAWLVRTLLSAPYSALVAAPSFAAIRGLTALLGTET